MGNAFVGTITGGTNSDPFVYNAPSNYSGPVTLSVSTDQASGVCSGGPSIGTDQIIITVDPLPTATAGGSNTICSDGSYTLGCRRSDCKQWSNIHGLPMVQEL